MKDLRLKKETPKMTQEKLRMEIVEQDGLVFVADYGQGVKSQHKSRAAAQTFIDLTVDLYNN